MAILDGIRRSVVGLCALTAVVVTPTTASARGDDANPLLELVDAATQRLQTAEPVAASKWNTGGSIEDPLRVEQVLAAVSTDAKGRGLTPRASGGYSPIRSMPPKPSNARASANGSSIRHPRQALRRTWQHRAKPSIG
jgi:Chorismate mutase type II